MLYFVVGTKAQLIKMAPIMLELDRRDVPYFYISTGQHKETMDELHWEFGIRKPDTTLVHPTDVVTVIGMIVWSFRLVRKLIYRDKRLFPNEDNGVVLVHGDTASTLIGALVGKRNGCQVGHVEAGLRSGHFLDPFPEEMIRRVVFRLADILFCPGQWALGNVRKTKKGLVDTGSNTLADSLELALLQRSEGPELPFADNENFGVVSIHRTENIMTRARICRIVGILEEISDSYCLLMVMHKTTENALRRSDLWYRINANPNIRVTPRYSYFDFISVLDRARFVISDGGSNQEECAYLGKPLLLLRRRTERIEGVGRNCIVSRYNRTRIMAFVRDHDAYADGNQTGGFRPSCVIADYCSRFA